MKSSSFYEIELKSLLTQAQYEGLCEMLPKSLKLINEEILHSTRYRPGDIRLRYSNKTYEIVCKEGDPTKICRKEVKVTLESEEQLNHFSEIFSLLGMKPDPSWIKHKKEFEYDYKGYKYIICLQNIYDFAYILEVEFLSDIDSSRMHEQNIREIINALGCEPINTEDFSRRIDEYIKNNSKNS